MFSRCDLLEPIVRPLLPSLSFYSSLVASDEYYFLLVVVASAKIEWRRENEQYLKLSTFLHFHCFGSVQ